MTIVFGMLVQCDTNFDLKTNVYVIDLHLMVQWFLGFILNTVWWIREKSGNCVATLVSVISSGWALTLGYHKNDPMMYTRYTAGLCIVVSKSQSESFLIRIDSPALRFLSFITEPPHDKTNEMACAPSEDSDQPGHPPSRIRVFAVRSIVS